MRPVALQSPANAIAVPSDRALRRRGTSHVGHRHAGAWPRLLRRRHRLCLRLRTPVTEQSHDLRLFTRRPRLIGPAVLPDLRTAAAGALLSAMITLVEVILAFVVTSALLLVLVHLLLPARKF